MKLCVCSVQKALEEAKVFVEKGELPKGMTEKPPQTDSQDSEGEEEAEEKEVWGGCTGRSSDFCYTCCFAAGGGQGTG